jgi:hypothetical protein
VQDFWFWLRRKIATFRQTEVYFTLTGPAENGHYSLILSDLPEVSLLYDRLPRERFEGKSLLLYLGSASALTEKPLQDAGITFSVLEIGNRPLYLLPVLKSAEREKLFSLLRGQRDYWILTKRNASQEEILDQLKLQSVLTGPAAFGEKHPDLQGEILINYFSDPSFHASQEEDFAILIDYLFEAGFQRLYPDDPEGVQCLQDLDPGKHLDVHLPRPSPLNPKTEAFCLRAGAEPVIEKTVWPGNQRLAVRWEEGRWRTISPSRFYALRPLFKIVWRNLLPILMIPLALIIGPITLLLWGARKFYHWLGRKLSH